MSDIDPLDHGSSDIQDLRGRSVVFVNRSYWPDGGATGQLLTQLCEDLANDIQVTVVCAHPSMLGEGLSYDRKSNEVRNGVRIVRVPHTSFGKRSLFYRMVDMLTFIASATWTLLRMPAPDVLVTETDPPFLCLLGNIVRRIKGVPLVCYLQDIYPDVVVSVGKLREGFITRSIRAAFRHAYQRATRVIVLSEDMLKQMTEVWGLDSRRIRCIRNWTDTDVIRPLKSNNRFRHINQLEDSFVVAYSGNMGLTQPIEDLLEAACLLRSTPDIQFALSGRGARCEMMKKRALEMQLPNLAFYDFRPYEMLADSLSAADVHIVFLDPKHERLLMPSKIYGVLASGSAVIVVGSPATELASLCVENKAGRVVSINNPRELADAILALHGNREETMRMGERARAYAETHCSRDVARGQFLALLQELLLPDLRPVNVDVERPTKKATVA